MRSLSFGIMVSANNVPLKSILTVSTDITENCPASANTSGYTIVNSIRSVAQTFGSVKLFKAYLGVTEQVPVSRALVLRSELQSSGVSLTDCPHNGRKDVADKMIIGVSASLQHTIFMISQLSVDMLAYAIDNPVPSTVVLISGDRDFAYALAMLRLRRYRVVLITLSNAHPSLRAQASLCFDWISDILEAIDPSHRPTSPRRKKTSSTPAHDKLYLETKSHEIHNPKFAFQQSYDEDSNIEFMNYFQDAKRRKEISQMPQKHGASDDLLPPDLDQSKRQPAVSSAATSALRNEPKTPARATDTSSCPLYLNGNMQTPLTTTANDLNSSQIPTPNASVGSTPKLPTHRNIPSRFSGPSPLRGSASLPNLAQDEVARESEPVSFLSTIRIPTPEPDLRAFSSSFKQGTYPSINTKPRSLSGVDHNVAKEDDRSDSPALSDISPLPTITTPLSTSPPSFMLPQPLSYSLESAVAPSPLKTPNPLQPAPYPTVPDKFRILIQCLKLHRSRGSRRPLRSQIGLEINPNGTTYRQAGVLKFGEYVEMAEKAGIVELGGFGGTSWVGLRAPWHDAPIS
jgi:NYN domain